MAIPFKNPEPSRRFTVATEKRALTRLFNARGVPRSSPGRLLVASWNIANLGAHKRWDSALQIIAHILKRFDLIAVQEVNDNFRNLTRVLDYAGRDFDFVMTDTAGNNERLAFVFRRSKVVPTSLEGELALRPRSYPKRTVRVRYRRGNRELVDVFPRFQFTPFDRNPYIASFQAGQVDFTLVNVHLYFGKFQNSRSRAERKKYARRVLEIFALSRWSDSQLKKPTVYNRNIVLLGDMNVPAMDKSESTYKALVRFGWKPVDYVSQVGGSNLGNDKTYDQMVFAPRTMGRRIKARGVFDFDNGFWKSLWRDLDDELPHTRAIQRFRRIVKHHISDHRPLWVELYTR